MNHSLDLHSKLRDQLRRRKQLGTLRALRKIEAGSELQDFSSNDYLDLSTSAELRHEMLRYLREESSIASTGSRLLSGNNKLAEDIEDEAKSYWQCETALLCPSGYEANVSIFGTIPQTGDTILYDELIHASVHIGMKHTRASKKIMFKHNNVHHLRTVLQAESSRKVPGQTLFIALETVYSMDGDTAPLADILNIVRQEYPEARLILDEAHATGVFGKSGQGLASALELNTAPEILLRLHTFGKGAGGTGAILLCDNLIKQYLLNYAKGLIYSTFMSTPALCLTRAALTLLSEGQTNDARTQLWFRIQFAHSLLRSLPKTNLISVPATCDSAIIPVLTKHALELSKYLEKYGMRVMPVRYPTVPRGLERIRICLRASIELDRIQSLINKIGDWIHLHNTVECCAVKDFQSSPKL